MKETPDLHNSKPCAAVLPAHQNTCLQSLKPSSLQAIMMSFLAPAGAQAAAYLHLLAQASELYRQRKYREASDTLQQAVESISTGFDSSDKWQDGHGHGRDRFFAWQRRCRILRDRYYKASRSDRAGLRRVADNTSEPNVFRVVAAYTLAVLAWDVGKWDKAAAWHRVGLVWVRQMPSDERSRSCTCEGANLDTCETSTVGQVANALRTSMLQHLRQLEDSNVSEPLDPCNWTRLDGSAIPRTVRLRRPGSSGMAPDELRRRTGVGGVRCDSCDGVGRHDFLLCCQGCGRAYYCSRTCQKRQWKLGHKEHCRGPHTFARGDVLRLEGIVAKPELNGQLVRAKNPIRNQPRWGVEKLSDGNTISVAIQNLRHIRPPV